MSIICRYGITHMKIDEQIATSDLERREFHLSIFACLAIVVLAGGLALLMYPSVFSGRENSANRILRVLRPIESSGCLHCRPPDYDSSSSAPNGTGS